MTTHTVTAQIESYGLTLGTVDLHVEPTPEEAARSRYLYGAGCVVAGYPDQPDSWGLALLGTMIAKHYIADPRERIELHTGDQIVVKHPETGETVVTLEVVLTGWSNRSWNVKRLAA